jgi:hypothetical protein
MVWLRSQSLYSHRSGGLKELKVPGNKPMQGCPWCFALPGPGTLAVQPAVSPSWESAQAGIQPKLAVSPSWQARFHGSHVAEKNVYHQGQSTRKTITLRCCAVQQSAKLYGMTRLLALHHKTVC